MSSEPSARPAAAPSILLVALAMLAMIATMYAALIYAPTDRETGDIQRIFYIHVPSALTMYVAIIIVFVASLLYLQSRDARWDEVAATGAEIGLLFGTIVIVTGPIWAKPVWLTWWTWDARLTSFFLLWLLFVGYVMLRSYGGGPEQVARFCAVLAILGFIGMPITHYAVQWFRTLHPQPILMTSGGIGRGMPGSMLATIAIGQVAMLVLFANLFALRLRLERQTRRVDELRRRLDLTEVT